VSVFSTASNTYLYAHTVEGAQPTVLPAKRSAGSVTIQATVQEIPLFKRQLGLIQV
jgi:hypothetical protein